MVKQTQWRAKDEQGERPDREQTDAAVLSLRCDAKRAEGKTSVRLVGEVGRESRGDSSGNKQKVPAGSRPAANVAADDAAAASAPTDGHVNHGVWDAEAEEEFGAKGDPDAGGRPAVVPIPGSAAGDAGALAERSETSTRQTVRSSKLAKAVVSIGVAGAGDKSSRPQDPVKPERDEGPRLVSAAGVALIKR